ncbi:MAG: ADP-ribosylglycohydrolase family protein [Acidimicrobiia bacterium]|nr:ADP-ribosylglycohydrolase family protein [Acidimicrobiia bacterium]
MTMTSQPSQAQRELFCPPNSSGDDRADRTRNSMLWAAYGDALGFISELTDEKGLKRRTKGAPLDRLMDWKRRVGGRGGVEVLLPAGCWSDDTQLRMAVSRSIGNHGFDVETFARIELPVWPSYGLGGGQASKAAAKNLSASGALWCANTFPGWCDAGGNGAAMRIQPHVWASPDLEGSYLLDVITDSICTHGHPRAIVGACFHASTLAHSLRTGAAPTLDECGAIAANLGDALSLIKSHQSLGGMWVGLWERESGQQFHEIWQDTVVELCDAIDRAGTAADAASSQTDAYRVVSDQLGLTDKRQQGSGILTTVAAAVLAALADNPYEASAIAANALDTDTDTIATMAGALLGACDASAQPPEEPLDSNYLLREADRLTAISQGHQVNNHQYPDTLTWVAPQTQADALVTNNGRLTVEGLGPVEELDPDLSWSPRKDFAWQWVQTDFGQTLLIKRRPELRSRKTSNTLEPPNPPHLPSTPRSPKAAKTANKESCPPSDAPLDRGLDIDAAVNHAKKNIDDNYQLGYTLRRTARDGSIKDLIALVSSLRDHLRR